MKIDPTVTEKYSGLIAGYALVSGVTMETESEGLEEEKQRALAELKSKYGEGSVDDLPEVKAYRDVSAAMGAEPSSTPAAEFLLKKALEGKLPSINNLVDACVLATAENMVVVSVFDQKDIEGEATIALAGEAGPFKLIGGEEASPKPDEIVLRDDKKVLSAYTLGDSAKSKVKPHTSSVILVAWNAPGIERENVEKALERAGFYTRKYCGGHVDESQVL